MRRYAQSTNVLLALLAAGWCATLAVAAPPIGGGNDIPLGLTGDEVETPCGRTTQIPGQAPNGKSNCSGNLTLTFEAGPVSLTYNSQYKQYPNERPDQGFGKSISAISFITTEGANITFVAEDGSEQKYHPVGKTGTVWANDDDVRGDLTLIRKVNVGYQLEEQPGRSRTVYTQKLGANWYPTESYDEYGGKTTYSNYEGSLPTVITDSSTNTQTRLSTSNGRVTKIKDADDLEYTFEYSPRGELTKINAPGLTHSLRYSPTSPGLLTSVTDPYKRVTDLTYYKHGRLSGYAQGKNAVLVEYSRSKIVTNYLNPSGGAIGFTLSKYDTNGFITETRAGDGTPSGNNPGRRSYSIARDPVGRLTLITDEYGRKTNYFYNDSAKCSSDATNPGTSRFPTCITSGDRTTQITRNANGLPLVVKSQVAGGKFVTTTYSWDKTDLLSKSTKDTQGRETSRETIKYTSSLPDTITTHTTTFIDQYDSLSRPARMTGPSGFEVTTNISGDGTSISKTLGGGSPATVDSVLKQDGEHSLIFTFQGVASRISRSFLGQTSQYQVGPTSAAAQDVAITQIDSSVRPGVGTIESKTSAKFMGGGGELDYYDSTSIAVQPMDGKSTQRGSSGKRSW